MITDEEFEKHRRGAVIWLQGIIEKVNRGELELLMIDVKSDYEQVPSDNLMNQYRPTGLVEYTLRMRSFPANNKMD